MPAERNQLRVVPIAGPRNAGARLTRPFGPNGFGGQFEIEDAAVVYTTRQDSAQAAELYRVPLTLTPAPNPPTTKLNGPLVAGGNVGSFRLVFRDVVYRADQDTDEVFELYRAHLNGSGKVKLNVPLPSTTWTVTDFAEAALGIRGYDILPDSSRVVYEINNPILPRQQLYSVPIAGPASNSVRLDDSPGGAPAKDMIYLVSSDSQRIIYEMADTNESFWLLSVPVAGPAGANTLLQFPSSDIPLFKISPNGRRTVYLFELGNGDTALFSVPVAGPASQTVRIDRGENPTVPLLVDSTNTKIVYPGLTTRWDLFSAPIDGSNDPVTLTEPLNSISISNVSLTANGRFAVYTVKRNGSNFFELYSSRLVPTAPANR